MNYIEFYISEDYPDALVLKPLENYVEPPICFVCDKEVAEYKLYKGHKICLDCKSIIDGTKVYMINRVVKRYTKVKTVKEKARSSNVEYVNYFDWCIMCGTESDIVMQFKGKNVCGECKNLLVRHSKNKIVRKIKMAVAEVSKEHQTNEIMVEEIRKLLNVNNIFGGVTLYYNNKAMTASTIENNVHPERFLDYYNAEMITVTYEVGSVLHQIFNGQNTGITEDGCDDFDWKVHSALIEIADKYNWQLDVYTEDSILFTPKFEFGSTKHISQYQTELGKQKSELRYGVNEEIEKIISKAYK